MKKLMSLLIIMLSIVTVITVISSCASTKSQSITKYSVDKCPVWALNNH